jgi:type II secretory pathway pseudopilin PulG
VNCLAVRERLAEHALGVLTDGDGSSLDRHLEWCAACRKEAGELQRAAATLAYSVAPLEPPPELEERVVETVREAASRRQTASPRRSRVAAAGVLAAMLALSGLGWGAVMAGRAERAEQQAADLREAQESAFRRFQDVFQLPEVDPAAIAEVSTLLSPRLREGRGDALVLLSPSGDDLAFVLVNGLTGLRANQLPLEVKLAGNGSRQLVVGQIRTLNSSGEGGVYRTFVEGLRGYNAVVIRDARGKVLLNGTLSVYEPTS